MSDPNDAITFSDRSTCGGTAQPSGAPDYLYDASAPPASVPAKPMIFEIPAPQAAILRTFTASHTCRSINNAAIKASPIEVVFTQLSIALHCEARCTICKEKVDLNDYDSW